MNTKAKILIVDNEAATRIVLHDALASFYDVSEADNGEHALQILNADPSFDLVLLDVSMPDMSGFDVCQALKFNSATHRIPVLFLSASHSPDEEAKGLSVGAEDFIHKSVSMPVLLTRVKIHLQLAEANHALIQRNQDLERMVQARTKELLRQSDQMLETQAFAIRAVCGLAGVRDNETDNHIRRTQHYIKALAERLRHHPSFADELSDEIIALLFRSAPLHDIGKIAIPDEILYKPGKHTPEEWEIMKRHVDYGYNAISRIEAEAGYAGNDYLRYAREIAYCHHEKWDGSGYPQGLVGEEIPLSARLMAVADVYDALISRRVYKPAYSHEFAVSEIAKGRGTHFDPDIVDAFLEMTDKIQHIAQSFADDPDVVGA